MTKKQKWNVLRVVIGSIVGFIVVVGFVVSYINLDYRLTTRITALETELAEANSEIANLQSESGVLIGQLAHTVSLEEQLYATESELSRYRSDLRAMQNRAVGFYQSMVFAQQSWSRYNSWTRYFAEQLGYNPSEWRPSDLEYPLREYPRGEPDHVGVTEWLNNLVGYNPTRYCLPWFTNR